jgi:hypothetical protein
MNPMYDDTYHADQIICQNLTEVTPSSVLGALRLANRERRVPDVDISHQRSRHFPFRCSGH